MLLDSGPVIAALLLFTLTPQMAAIRALADQDIRVAHVGHRLARAGRGAAEDGWCDGVVTMSGMVVQDGAQFPAQDRLAAKEGLQIGDGPTIVAVLPDTGAAWAKLKPGDRIVSINGEKIDANIRRNPYARMAQLEQFLAKPPGLGNWTIEVLRADGSAFGSYLVAQAGCPSVFQVLPRKQVNARADGRYVQIYSGMLDFVRNDDELAAVVAHELAHNILKHQARKTPSKQAEYEADRLSVALVMRAGYRIDAIVPFWTRFEARTNAGIFADGTHPSAKKRIAALVAAVEALKDAPRLVASPK
jgi:beta-barrel assembly-enhancing protease